MADRKHITELALSFYSDGLILLHAKDISKINQQPEEYIRLANDCHIYFIIKRPRIAYVPGSIVVGDERTTGRFKYVKDGVLTESGFGLQGKPDADVIEISD